MKKIFFTLLAVISTINFVSAQNYSHDISLTAGLSIPLGQFASSDVDNENPGLAKTGTNINLSYNFSFNKYWSVKTSFMYGTNKIEEEAIAASYDSATVVASNWGNKSAFIGGQFTIPNDKVDFFVAGQVGYAIISSPSYSVKYSNSSYADGVGSFEGNGIAYLTTLGIKLKPSESFGVLFSVELFNTSIESDNFTQPVNTLNTKIGLSYSF